MARYFKIIEIHRDSFFEATGDDLDCSQLITPTNEAVYVAVDDTKEYEITIPLDVFDE